MTTAIERLLRQDRLVLGSGMVLLFALAALYTVLGVGMNMSALDMTAMSDMRDMPGKSPPGEWSVLYAVLVFLMWWVMMIAMMLPSVSPTVLLHAALLRHAGRDRELPWVPNAFLAGYLVCWAAFSALAAFAQWLLEKLGIVSATMMTLIDSTSGGFVLVVAGAYQFSPLKAVCLEHCRTPAQFIAERKRPGASGAFLMGMEHGAYCLGCCWFLMLLLFVGGIMNLYWIVGLTAFVAVEKLAPFGDKLAKVAGAALIAYGGFIIASSL